ncbi:MAG: hypothetical protein IH630_07020 [Thermoplasmata archaeon]|nr:hypothetical protein [Thermoplasmata archaeon]
MNFRENVESVKREHGIVGRDRELEKAVAALKVRIHLMMELPRMGRAKSVVDHIKSPLKSYDGSECAMVSRNVQLAKRYDINIST